MKASWILVMMISSYMGALVMRLKQMMSGVPGTHPICGSSQFYIPLSESIARVVLFSFKFSHILKELCLIHVLRQWLKALNLLILQPIIFMSVHPCWDEDE